MEVWLDGIYEEHDDGGKLLCHVFAGGKRIATFEPQGGVFGYRLKPKRWDEIAKTAEMAFLWPLQENRAPGTVMLLTLLRILLASVMARRGFGVRPSPGAATWIGRGRHWNPNATITRALRKLLLLLGEKAGMRADQQRRAGVPPAPDRRDACPTLTPRERRWFVQPVWRQSLSVFLIVAMVLATTNTNVHAAIPNPIFYYHVGDHLGSSNLVTDRNGALVQHREYWAFGQQRVRSESAQDYVFNRYTGQVFDDETGLYYYGARYYDPELGRFIQPDTIVPSPGDPQTLNRYSYVNNNPLKYVDPSGHDFGITALIIAVVVGAAIGGATAAATGGNIGMGILTGAIGGLFGFAGAWAGGVLGSTAGGFAGAVAGGAAGGAVNAAITGGNIGMGALTGAIAGAIGFGVSQLQIGVWGGSSPGSWGDDLFGFASSSAGGALGGGIGAELQGGDFADGAMGGAIGGAIGYGIAVDLPDAYRNANSANPRFHLFFGLLTDAWGGLTALATGQEGAWSGFGEGAKIGLAGEIDAFTFGKVKGAFGTDTTSREYGFARGAGVVARDSLLTAAGAGGAKALGSATGGVKQWVRVGPSYSHAAGQKTALSVRWGASPKYANKIGNAWLRSVNQSLRQTRIPLPGPRFADPGHAHIIF